MTSHRASDCPDPEALCDPPQHSSVSLLEVLLLANIKMFVALRTGPRYHPVSGSDGGEEAAPESPVVPPPVTADAPAKHEWVSTAYLCFSIFCLFAGIWSFLDQQGHHVSDERCLRVMSAPSMVSLPHILSPVGLPYMVNRVLTWISRPLLGPVLEAVEMEWTAFDDLFVPDEYSGYPSNRSEAAWARLWDCELATA